MWPTLAAAAGMLSLHLPVGSSSQTEELLRIDFSHPSVAAAQKLRASGCQRHDREQCSTHSLNDMLEGN